MESWVELLDGYIVELSALAVLGGLLDGYMVKLLALAVIGGMV